MELDMKNVDPLYVMEGENLMERLGNQKIWDLTARELECLVKFWMIETLTSLTVLGSTIEINGDDEPIFYPKIYACKLLGMSPAKFQAILKQGKVKFRRIGGRMYFTRNDLQNFALSFTPSTARRKYNVKS